LATIPLSLGLCKKPPGFLFLLTRGPWAGNRAEQNSDGRVPATVVAGGEVQGQESGQGLTAVVLSYVSWTRTAGTVKFDLSPR
jgi:hypothetical protein